MVVVAVVVVVVAAAAASVVAADVVLGPEYHTVLLELGLLKSQLVLVAFCVRRPRERRKEQEFSVLSMKASPVSGPSQEL